MLTQLAVDDGVTIFDAQGTSEAMTGDPQSLETRIRNYREQATAARDQAKTVDGAFSDVLLFSAAKWELVASKLEHLLTDLH